ncbi:ParA family protein (plasmid) [Legionella sp. D16C41]|uniref:ParA family protein n=1 Tax=Legionella sp. D16C41 TaxID=3402688 RepID=UPI003AF6E7DB
MRQPSPYPSNLNNSRLDTELTQSSTNLKDLVRDTIKPIRNNYDLVIIDCPSAINKINTAVTCASDPGAFDGQF